MTPGPLPETETRVLLVDDQPTFRRAAAMVIRATAGLVLTGEAATGEEAVALARALNPDLVLMDVRLPGISGPQATRLILAERPATRVILLSTYEAEDLPDIHDCGAERFLRKQDLDGGQLLP